MGFDAMANYASVPAIASRDAGKKKRINRSAKLKQCKLDARREQWLSQVKNKEGKNSGPHVSSPPHPPLPRSGKGNLETTARVEEEREEHNISDLDSPTHSTTSCTSGNSSRRKGCPTNSISSGSSTESTSRNVSDAEEEEEPDGREEENGVLDDWEAVADALFVGNDNNHANSNPVVSLAEPASSPGTRNAALCRATTKPQPIQPTPRAWRADDVFRPQSLPSISKQRSLPVNMERHCSAIQQGILALPSPCPICYEDLDPTDSSFLPCSCGFHLCLFCHKRILEADGRCPGCRKQYETMGVAMDVDSGEVSKLSVQLSPHYTISSRS